MTGSFRVVRLIDVDLAAGRQVAVTTTCLCPCHEDRTICNACRDAHCNALRKVELRGL